MDFWQFFYNNRLVGYFRNKTFTEENLPEFKTINTTSLNVANPLISFNRNTGIWTANKIGWAYIDALMKWNYSRWIYEGLPEELTKQEIERLLFVWGKCAIFKYKNEFYASNFDVKRWDLHKRPLKIEAILDGPDKKQLRIPLTCGVDTEVIYENVGHWWGKLYVGPLLMGLHLLNALAEVDIQIAKNRMLLNQKLIVSPDMSLSDQAKLLNTWKQTDQLLLPLDTRHVLEGSTRTAGNAIANGIISFLDHSKTLIELFQFREDQLKKFFGIRKNANSMKREKQITAEVGVDNVIPDRIADTSLEFRSDGFDRVNKTLGTNITVEIEESEQQEDSMFSKSEQEPKENKE